MWNTAQNAIESSGLKAINPVDEPFDFHLHSAESTEHDSSLPNGYVIKTLKFGYLYNDKVIRRAIVVVNKINAPPAGGFNDQDTGDQESNEQTDDYIAEETTE
jgi:molecular chaperone GrpE